MRQLLLLLITLFTVVSCSEFEYEGVQTSGSIDESFFGASFVRVFENRKENPEEEVDTISYPILGVPESFEAMILKSRIRTRNGVRKAVCEINTNSFFLDYDEDQFFSSHTLGFEFNIAPTTDIVDTIPFTREALDLFFHSDSTYSNRPDIVGSIQMYYREIGRDDIGIVNKSFVSYNSETLENNTEVSVTGYEEYDNFLRDGTYISSGLSINLEFTFDGYIMNSSLPFTFEHCRLLNGQATVYIDYL